MYPIAVVDGIASLALCAGVIENASDTWAIVVASKSAANVNVSDRKSFVIVIFF